MLKDSELNTFESWIREELEEGNRLKASKVFKVYKKHFLNKYSGNTEEQLINMINRR